MSGWELGQLNVGCGRGTMDEPIMAGFAAELDRINALGEASPGFVWRLRDDNGNATAFRVFDDPRVIVNLTVWTSAEALSDFAYRSDHVEPFRRRREWFEPFGGPSLVLWWVPAGHRPDLDEAIARLERLAADGPSPDAFTLRERFPAPG